MIEEEKRVIEEDYKYKFDRKLNMLFEKMCDIQRMLEDRATFEEIEKLKREQHEIDCRREDAEHRKITQYDRYNKQQRGFERGYYE